jgi:hypothetical protein
LPLHALAGEKILFDDLQVEGAGYQAGKQA